MNSSNNQQPTTNTERGIGGFAAASGPFVVCSYTYVRMYDARSDDRQTNGGIGRLSLSSQNNEYYKE